MVGGGGMKKLKNLWEKWTIVQKIILFGVVAVIVIGFVFFSIRINITGMVPVILEQYNRYEDCYTYDLLYIKRIKMI